MLDALLDTLSQPSLHPKARVCVAVPGITLDPNGVTYSADLGDRGGEGRDPESRRSRHQSGARKTMGDLTRARNYAHPLAMRLS